MAHVRQQVRALFKSILDTVAAAQGATVTEFLVYPEETADLPAYNLTTPRDVDAGGSEEPQTIGKRVDHELSVQIEIRSKPDAGGDTPQDELDAHCSAIEAAIMADPTLGAKVRYTQLDGTEVTTWGEQERPGGKATMEWGTVYSYIASDPETLIYAD